MTHPKHDEWAKYLYGEIKPQRQKLLTEHLQECDECSQKVNTWQSAMRSLDGWKWTNGGSSQANRFIMGAARWAAVVLLILALGAVIGRFSAGQTDMEQLERTLISSLEPKLQQSITQQIQSDWNVLTTGQDQLRDEIQAQVNKSLNEVAAGTYMVSYNTMEEMLSNLIMTLEETLGQLEHQRLADHERLQNNLVHFAVQTNDKIMRNHQELEWLLTSGSKIKDQDKKEIKKNTQITPE